MYMANLTLITSIINTPNTPLSYTNVRSIYTKDERFEQTKKTIETIKLKIPNNKIIVVECSKLTQDEHDYFTNNTDYFINIYTLESTDIINRMYTLSKSLGEGTMTKYAVEYILNHNIEFDHLFKISGRYWLNDHFNYQEFDNEYSVIHYINNDFSNAFTALYKLPKKLVFDWLFFLQNADNLFFNCIGYEIIFAIFIKKYTEIKKINKVGISGYVSGFGNYMEM